MKFDKHKVETWEVGYSCECGGEFIAQREGHKWVSETLSPYFHICNKCKSEIFLGECYPALGYKKIIEEGE